ncbi:MULTISPECIES: hypothetical protein [Vibrio]|jgi:hypothetical protein|uniref:DUF4145 domain-containing protein n=6 Tax=Vibrio harveyi group TaxID=717610 RepID=A0A0H0Y844_VIBAL|nr:MULTISPECIES: hypothetical protein [Vibrio]EEZ81064.1 conserved hypothetical protein [Vibrio alginolyticus 40B]MDG2785380.1 DUF4145 domain-containing protein [Vibrio parahaemolyticus]MDW1810609.1 DUF4145 domain-containing protein [Vibrio sp. Vb2362]MDW1971542.1 DUF4145 domain-containing protein [Vibrio sp. 945]MDW2260342.1 DUF4145 domain-containing protein [Vibrio sp. 1409]MDW2297484.1 DUF4145 domain-containing protein [Vibrio sp. 1404]MEA3482184.1 DUF4145 domain-containing protein [Pseud
MSDIEKVVMRTRTIEKLLRTQYHAEGKGLHQLINSCEERLPHDVIAKLRFIATVRNKVVHEDDYKLDDRKGFMAACDACEKELTPRSSRFIWRTAILLMTLITLAALGFYYMHWDILSKHIQ